MKNEDKNVVSFSELAKKHENDDLRFITEEERELYDVNENKMKRLEAIDECLANLVLDPYAPEIKPVDDGFVKGSGNALLYLEAPLPFEIATPGVKETIQKILRLSDYVYIVDKPDDAAIGIFLTVYDVLKRKGE